MAKIKIPHPPYRELRHFAFDPILSRRIETSDINEVTSMLRWEKVEPGPADDYLEVVDYDPASRAFYAPVDLNDKYILAQDGLAPSESSPQFHQQMAYAVARTTIGHFERALGRKVLWSPYLWYDDKKKRHEEYVRRLRIYPHAMRDANAYYTHVKKALLFGYFAAGAGAGENMPGETVFTCLSMDIVAHETSHALLDGLHRRFIEPSNPDVLALHEAFADIVALFQHFTYPEVLRHQIGLTRGDLQRQNLLGQLAYQFGQAVGNYGALRSAIGHNDEKGRWVPEEPDPAKIHTVTEPHTRGAILVAAVFEAFLSIYKSRIASLLRIASGGSGILPAGELHPDLVDRLAAEAAKTARHVLQMCIRATDYMSPVDNNFGNYLRALITADCDMVKDDRYNYRLTFMEAFRRRGIYPGGVRNLSEEALRWSRPTDAQQDAFSKIVGKKKGLRRLLPEWELTTDRRAIYENTKRSRRALHGLFAARPKQAQALAIILDKAGRESFWCDEKTGIPYFEVHSARPARRVGPEGQTATDLVIEVTQRRRGYLDADFQERVDQGKIKPLPEADFIFRGGFTLLVDPDTAEIRYFIHKNIANEERLKETRKYMVSGAVSLRATYCGDPRLAYYRDAIEMYEGKKSRMDVVPFAFIHQPGEEQEAWP